MNEFKELDVLENADDTVKERLAEEFPPQDSNEKERVFSMSERKYNIKRNNSPDNNFDGEESVKGVEVYKRPKWKIFASLAACAAIAAGIGGGGYMMNQMKNSRPVQYSSEMESEPSIPEQQEQVAPFGDFSELEYYIPTNEPEKNEKIYLRENDENSPVLTLSSGKSIEKDKRDRLADFFNSYTPWEKYTDETISQTKEEITDTQTESIEFAYRGENEIRTITITEDNILYYMHFDIIQNKDGRLIKVNYGETEESGFPCEMYKVNYEFFKDTINNILYEESITPPLQCDDLEVIVQTLEKYDDFRSQERIADDPSKENRDYRLVSDDENIELYKGNVLSDEKREKMLTVIKNADWTSEPIPDDKLFEYEQNGIASDPNFNGLYSFMEVCGDDFITLEIYHNIVEMSFFNCQHNEADDTYAITNESRYYMRTASPAFMSDINEILTESSASGSAITIQEDAGLLDKKYRPYTCSL